MSGRIKKQTAWWIGLLNLNLFFLAVVFKAPEQLGTIGEAIVYAVAISTGFFIAGNVADNGVKGRFYRPELDKKEP